MGAPIAALALGALLALALLANAPRAFSAENERTTRFLLVVAVGLLVLGAWRLLAYRKWRASLAGVDS
jgi:high-affinity Fe2+/Pb2+ permease